MQVKLWNFLPGAGRHQWELLTNIHSLPSQLSWQSRARITVAGQWRNLTALPEHSVAGQKNWMNNRKKSHGRRIG
jgi:hypothetical protein